MVSLSRTGNRGSLFDRGRLFREFGPDMGAVVGVGLILSLGSVLFGSVGCAEEPTLSPPSSSAHPTTEWEPTGGGEMPPYMEFDLVLVPASELEVVVRIPGPISPDYLEERYGLTVVEAVTTGGETLLRMEIPEDFDLTRLRQDPYVRSADLNSEVNLIEVATLLVGFLEGDWQPGVVEEQKWLETMRLADAHQFATGEGVTIAVLDTGVDIEHPMLAGRLQLLPEGLGLSSAETTDGIDNDEDGLVDEAYGHGTHVAGCAVQVAPGAEILPIRVINDDGVGSLWDILHGLSLAIDFGADVINLSFSMSDESESMEVALIDASAARIAVLAAAGNYGNDDARYPATSAHAVGVGSVSHHGKVSAWSGAGSVVSLAAPGETILSAYPGGELWYASGTSMATPIAAGCVALLIDGWLVDGRVAVKQLKAGATGTKPPWAFGSGWVDPLTALVSAQP